MNVLSLFIYPVKSLSGISVPYLELDDFGPSGDRRWMIVDGLGKFVTQRRLPRLALIEVSLHDGVVSIGIPGQGEFALKPTSQQQEVTVWRDQVLASEAQQAVNEALSGFCGEPLRLVYMPDSTFRRVDPERVSDVRRVGFADGFPFLIANAASLEELNGRLPTAVDIRRFRPNIVISGAGPWAEDAWRALTVGGVNFRVVKPCSRCVLTTVDPDTGKKDPDTEPLKTLSGYRKTGDGVIFGQNAVHDGCGRVSVGDSVSIFEQEC
ncbi:MULTISPECIES: MOSC domain-containing protein [unclassified Marinobacter]|uniref:MOSC domain-containing protein n=1 Tax=unclassified Marinobacter TaxID=83889 RepID=UPI00273C0628|nr:MULTISPECIES: MOSC N-terminal beta barrel domain-containing protein [unclassified Marinobacter]MDP4548933.1 MOSC domain-containing protein [Marinobacter sp. MDS2]